MKIRVAAVLATVALAAAIAAPASAGTGVVTANPCCKQVMMLGVPA